MSDLPVVELCPAFVFTCEGCGQDSFARSVRLEDPELQARAATAFREIIEATDGGEAAEDWDGLISLAPEQVTCSHCGQQFQVFAEELDSEVLQMFLDDYEDDDFDDDDDLFEEDDWDDDDEDWDDEEGDDDEDFDEELDEDM